MIPVLLDWSTTDTILPDLCTVEKAGLWPSPLSRPVVGPSALGHHNPTVCSLACRWRLQLDQESFSTESGPLLELWALSCSIEYRSKTFVHFWRGVGDGSVRSLLGQSQTMNLERKNISSSNTTKCKFSVWWMSITIKEVDINLVQSGPAK